jgi:hypothetical protein
MSKANDLPNTLSSLTSCNNVFPRTNKIPIQSPKYWVKEKDRYLRQLLIRDVQEDTGRELVIYFTNFDSNSMISGNDANDLSEVLSDCKTKDVDILIHTPGGYVDACEQVISVLKLWLPDGYRVIVPSMAKSAGTVVALSATEIVMGVNSELGPIDPQFNNIPAEFIANDPNAGFQLQQIANNAILRMHKLAKNVVSSGMWKGKDEEEINKLIEKLSSTQSYLSHGAVINVEEALNLGLVVNYLQPKDEIWKRIWLLFCMYDYDCRQLGYSKIFEGERISLLKPLSSS